MILGMLARFCAVDGTAISEKASVAAPRNTLFVYVSVVDGFKKLLWSLHPTEVRNGGDVFPSAPLPLRPRGLRPLAA